MAESGRVRFFFDGSLRFFSVLEGMNFFVNVLVINKRWLLENQTTRAMTTKIVIIYVQLKVATSWSNVTIETEE